MESKEFKKMFKVIKQAKKGNDKLMATAFHEAGHVMIDLIYGFPVKYATIIPDSSSKSAGSVPWVFQGLSDFMDYYSEFTDYEDDLSIDKIIEYHVLILIGGIIGGSFYSGKYDWDGAYNDLNQILDVFLSYGIDEIESLQPFWDKTFDLISKYENDLIKIASDLYKNKILASEYFENYKLTNLT